MNAFQHYIAAIERYPMCLVETTLDVQSKKAQIQIDRRVDILAALGDATLPISALMKITPFTQGQLAKGLHVLQDQGKVVSIPQPPGKPTMWRRK